VLSARHLDIASLYTLLIAILPQWT